MLKGAMSFVCSRPALWNQYDLIEARTKLDVDKVRPGITGWSQVNERNELPMDVKAELAGYYASHVTFLLDMKILWKIC